MTANSNSNDPKIFYAGIIENTIKRRYAVAAKHGLTPQQFDDLSRRKKSNDLSYSEYKLLARITREIEGG